MKKTMKAKVLAPKKPLVMPKATGKGKITSVKSIRQMERRYHVLRLRKEGHTIREISQILMIAEGTVTEDLKFVLKLTMGEIAETVEESRALQVSRLDAMLKKYQPLAEAGNVSAASMVLQIESRRSKLLALDVPEVRKVETTGIREYVGVDIEKV